MHSLSSGSSAQLPYSRCPLEDKLFNSHVLYYFTIKLGLCIWIWVMKTPKFAAIELLR